MQLFDNSNKKESFEELIARLDIKEFTQYYLTHNQDETRKQFQIGIHNLKHLIKHFNIVKTQKQITECTRNTWASFDTSKENILKKLVAQISKEELVQYYITENHSFEETYTHFNITNKYLLQLIKEYNCYKPKTISHEIHDKTCLEKYGNANYNNREKCVKTCRELYGVDNISQTADFYKKAQETWKSHGYTHPMRNDEILQRQHQSMVSSSKASSYNGIFSVPNRNFAQLLEKNNIEYTQEFGIARYFYDFKVGDTLIEINPSATHNSTWGIFGEPKEADYHKKKTQTAIQSGYRCINVWDWDDLEKIIDSLKPRTKVYARKCQIFLTKDKKSINNFLTTYHFQGSCSGQDICLGLEYNNELIQVMTFGKSRYNKKYEYELLRLCTRSDYYVVGGAERLFKYFIETYNPQSIISYCDNAKFKGDVYERLGMKLLRYAEPSRHWYNFEIDRHITDNLLRQRGFDQLLGETFGTYGKGTSNDELMKLNGFVEVYDAGQSTYTWNKLDNNHT